MYMYIYIYREREREPTIDLIAPKPSRSVFRALDADADARLCEAKLRSSALELYNRNLRHVAYSCFDVEIDNRQNNTMK